MPSARKRGLREHAVVWPYYDRDNNGNPRVSTPVEIRCHWEDGQRQVFVTASSVAIDAEVQVDREIAIGSMIRKGRLKDLPDTPDDIKEVVTYNEVPDAQHRIVDRTVMLRRYQDELPTVVT